MMIVPYELFIKGSFFTMALADNRFVVKILATKFFSTKPHPGTYRETYTVDPNIRTRERKAKRGTAYLLVSAICFELILPSSFSLHL